MIPQGFRAAQQVNTLSRAPCIRVSEGVHLMDAAADEPDNAPMNNDTQLELPPPEAAGDDQQRPSGGTGDRPLLRRYDGILGGVATGLAGHFRMAPWLIRLAFVVVSFFGGLGILLYLAGWLLIPAEGNDRSIAERWLEETGTGRSWIGAALIALAAIWLLTSLDIARSGPAWAVALLVLGILLYRGENPPDQGTQDHATSPEGQVVAPVVVSSTAGTTPQRRPRAHRQSAPRPSRPPSMLGRYTLAVGLIGVGILALLDNAGAIFPDARHYLALAVAIVGTGLLIGSFWGRSRMLILAGLLLAFLMGLATIGKVVDTFADEVRTYRPATIEEVATNYTMDSGTLIVDLTSVDWQNREIGINAELGAGKLEIKIPNDVGATVSARAGIGQVDVFGRLSEGLGVGRSATVEGPAGAGDITLTVRVGAGQVTVTQESNS